MPTGMAGLLQDAGVTTPTKTGAPAPTSAAPKGMAGLLADAKVAAPAPAVKVPTQTKTPTSTPFVAPLFGSLKTAATTAPATPAFQTPGSKITSNTGDSFTPPNPIPLSLPDQAAGKTVQPSLTQKIGGDLKDMIKAPAPTQTPLTLKSSFDNTFGDNGIVTDTINNWSKTVSDVQNLPPSSASETDKIAAVGKAGMDAINAFFTPVSDVFQKAATIPGPVGQLANLVNKGFAGIGIVGGDSLESALRASPLSDETKNKLAPLANQIGALAAQIVAGKVGHDAFTELKTKTSAFLDTLHQDSLMKELNNNPVIQQHLADQQASTKASARLTDQANAAKVNAVTKLPIKVADASTAFKKSLATPGVKEGINTGKAADMHPTLRQDIRASVAKHGENITHTELVKQHGAGDRQALALIKEAPRPSNAAEAHASYMKALSTTLQLPETVGKGNGPIQGNGFTMADKVDPAKVAEGKRINAYRDALAKHIDKPTPKTLAAVLKARDAMNNPPEAKPVVTKDAPRPVSSKPGQKTVKTPAVAPIENTVAEETPAAKVGKNADGATKPIERPTDESNQRVTKVANDINESLVKQGLEKLTPEQQSKYTSGSYKGSDAKVAQMMSDDIESVKKMAQTGEGIPDGVHPQILFNAIEALADKQVRENGDSTLSRSLGKSPLGKELSEAGATLGSHAYNDNPNSTVKALRKANDVKMGGKAGQEKIKAEVKKAKATITKTASRLIDYDKIIDTITC